MLTSDFDFIYPEELVAIQPQKPSRILLAGEQPKEITKADVLTLFQAGDVLVINETKVIPKKISVTTQKNKNIDILFLKELDSLTWTVLLPLSRLQKGEILQLPDGVKAEVVAGDLPQTLKVTRTLSTSYFEAFGKMPLPPYIEKARKNKTEAFQDSDWYQTTWAQTAGSAAAPTASFHFDAIDLEFLKEKGVLVEKICLHVGLGTFLSVQSENLLEHKMHSEYASVKVEVWDRILQAKQQKYKIWALGTTVCRTLESIPLQKLERRQDILEGETDIFIYPGHTFQVVDVLLTNFHQPKSTLLALVAAFSNLELVKKNYQWAIKNRFRLFSYGDLSVWYRDRL